MEHPHNYGDGPADRRTVEGPAERTSVMLRKLSLLELALDSD